MTMAVREDSGSFCCPVEAVADGAADAAEDQYAKFIAPLMGALLVIILAALLLDATL
jgi:hypothetical protein